MLAKVYSAAVTGLDCEIVEVEVDLARGLPAFNIVGLPDAAVQESKERVRSAVKNADCEFHRQRITVNLAPADIRKAGPSYDFPIAIGILQASGQLKPFKSKSLVIGELALDGKTRSVAGLLPIVITAKKKGFHNFFVPAENAREASIIEDISVYPVESLRDFIAFSLGEQRIKPLPRLDPAELIQVAPSDELDFSHVCGQEHAKRALSIAAAGGHNILMSGPPGSGKTMLARAFRTILPALTLPEMLETTKIYSVAGLLPTEQPLVFTPPFRNVHHTASAVSIVGGGTAISPGEISLANRGVLFLDEIAEFPTKVLEVLRQPLEDGVITISRASGTLRFPAQFTLIAAMNPCPCGFATDRERACRCSASEIVRYQKRLSGPLLDRIDLHIEVPRVSFKKLAADEVTETSIVIQAKVQKAREIQKKRFENSKITNNSEMSSGEVKRHCLVDVKTEELLKQAVTHFQLSARAYYRVLKLARTIADLEGNKRIILNHVAEALQYRPKLGEE